MKFRGALFDASKGKLARAVERKFEVDWTPAGVATVFTETRPRPKEELQLWTPADYLDGHTRGNSGVSVLNHAVLDGDAMDIGDFDLITRALAERGFAFIAYTSSSHRVEGKVHDHWRTGCFDCFRLILPLTRQVSQLEYKALVPGLFGFEVLDLSAKYQAEAEGVWVPRGRGQRAARPRGFDATSGEPGRGYFVPTYDSTVLVSPGGPVDVEAVLARPTTARARAGKVRPRQPATMEAVGAMGALERALAAHGFGLDAAAHDGWRRSTCPNCQDPSPSMTCRANGDGIDIRCWAACPREEILEAIGLDAGGLFRAPSPRR
jgi:hypothetical protein